MDPSPPHPVCPAGPDYCVRRSARARRIGIRIDAEHGVTLILPAGADAAAGHAFVRQKWAWITRKLAELRSSQDAAAGQGGPPVSAPLLGSRLPVLVRIEPGAARVQRTAEGFVVSVADVGWARAALGVWFWRTAAVWIPQRVLGLAERLGFQPPRRVRVADQRRRWGSCSAGGRLAFNWRLILAPEAVLDYVIVHELVHLDHPHHRASFWGEVARLCPEHRQHREWLKTQGEELLRDWRL